MFRNKIKLGALILLALAAMLMVSLSGSTQPANDSLRFFAQKRGISIGTAAAIRPLRKDSTYQTVLAREFNMLTPENEMKFKPIHPERDRYDFVAADTLVDFAKRHDMQVRGHTLVWYQSEPDWLTATQYKLQRWMSELAVIPRT